MKNVLKLTDDDIESLEKQSDDEQQEEPQPENEE